MDTEGKNVARFLEALQTGRDRLGLDFRNKLILEGATTATPFLVLSGRPFRIHNADSVREFSGSVALGIHAKPQAGEAQDNLICDLHNFPDTLKDSLSTI